MKKENKAKIAALLAQRALNKTEKDVGTGSASSQIPTANLQRIGKRTGVGAEEIEGETEGVKDIEAYRLWRRLKALPILNDEMKVKCSDGQVINIGWFKHTFEERTNHLPIEEREALYNKRQLYYETHLKAVQAKMKAYGTNMVKKAQERAAGRAKELGFLKSRKAQLVELFGRMFTSEEIHKIIVEDWNFPVSLTDVIDFKRNNLAVIQEKQEIHKREYSDLRLVQKRSRLEELTGLYNRLADKIKVTVNREDIRVMTSILVEIRREIEGERIQINGKLDLNIESDINTHLQKEVFKEFSLTQIIVGRVASRMRVHSSRIIQGLNNSYYARYNKFLGNEPEDADWEEIEYPSAQGFDFEKIPRLYKEKELAASAEISRIKSTEGEIQLKVAQSGLKAALLLKLSEKTGDVKRDKLRIDEVDLKRRKEEALNDKAGLRDKKQS